MVIELNMKGIKKFFSEFFNETPEKKKLAKIIVFSFLVLVILAIFSILVIENGFFPVVIWTVFIVGSSMLLIWTTVHY